MADSKNSKISELTELTTPVGADVVPIVDSSDSETKKITYANLVAEQTTDIATNTANIATNTAKVGITTAQADAITANTAKTGITTAQADAIVANTAKTGITSSQAAAINTNASDITTLQSDKAPLASPTFTGNPTAPTQSSGDNSTKLATTAYVDAQNSPNNKGFFATESALTTAYSTGQNGWYAIVGTTDTFWVWDSDTSAWVNTDSNSQGTVTSVGVSGFNGIVVGTTPVTTSGNLIVGISSGITNDIADNASDIATNTTNIATNTTNIATNTTNIATNTTNIASKAPTASPTFTGSIEFDGAVTMNNGLEAEDAVFNDQVELASGAEISAGSLQLTDGGDVSLTGGSGKIEMTGSGQLKVGDLEINETEIQIANTGELIRLGGDERMLIDQNNTPSLDWTDHDSVQFGQSTSKVGIRKSPTSALDVNGTIKANSLNVNSQKFYVDPNDDYIKAGSYGSGDFAAITGSENQPKTTPAFGNNGKVVEKTFIKTIKLQGTGFVNLDEPETIVAAAGAGKYNIPLEMTIFSDYGTRAGEWGNQGTQASLQIGTFQNSDNTGNFVPFLTLPVSTAESTGDWLAHKTFRNIEGKQFANRDIILKGSNIPSSEANSPDGEWYIRLEYMILGESAAFENNVDQTVGVAF